RYWNVFVDGFPATSVLCTVKVCRPMVLVSSWAFVALAVTPSVPVQLTRPDIASLHEYVTRTGVCPSRYTLIGLPVAGSFACGPTGAGVARRQRQVDRGRCLVEPHHPCLHGGLVVVGIVGCEEMVG